MKSRSAILLYSAIALCCAAVPAFAGTNPTIPEPTTVLLIGGGLGGILVVRHFVARKK